MTLSLPKSSSTRSKRTRRTVQPNGFSPDKISRLQSNHLEWQHLEGGPQFDYPIDYSKAVTSVDRATGLIRFLAKWAPNAYCHYRRHLGRTASRVLQGEHHIVETTETRTLHKTRRPGFQGQSPRAFVGAQSPDDCAATAADFKRRARRHEILAHKPAVILLDHLNGRSAVFSEPFKIRSFGWRPGDERVSRAVGGLIPQLSRHLNRGPSNLLFAGGAQLLRLQTK